MKRTNLPKTSRLPRVLTRSGNGRHAHPKEAAQDPTTTQLADGSDSHNADPQVWSRKRRALSTLGVLVLGATVAASIPAVHNFVTGHNSAPSISSADAAGTIHDLARSVVGTYVTTVEDHTGLSHTEDGGKKAVVTVVANGETMALTVTSAQTRHGPDGKLMPDPRYATSVTAAEETSGGDSTASMTDEHGVVRIINTGLSTDQAQQLSETVLRGDDAVTSYHELSMGHRPIQTQPNDRTPETALGNLDAAESYISQVDAQVISLLHETPVIAGASTT